jgi:phage tail sheath protein FI
LTACGEPLRPDGPDMSADRIVHRTSGRQPMPIDPIPGTFIDAIDASSNTVVGVATAVPAFIGYTPRADHAGASYFHKPVKIGSFAEFAAIFLPPEPATPSGPAHPSRPQYYVMPQRTEPRVGASLMIGNTHYAVLPDPDTIYHLCNSVRLFYLNGGGDAYIVSVGACGQASGKPLPAPDAPLVNANVKLTDLLDGLAQLEHRREPTLYVCPDAVLLGAQDNATLMQAMLAQAQRMGTAMCLFDVVNGDRPDPVSYTQDIAAFRSAVGNVGLDFGACYYPFICTSMMESDELDYSNLFGSDVAQLAPLLDPPGNPDPAAAQILQTIRNPPPAPQSNAQLQTSLLRASSTYAQIMQQVLAVAGVLPASGAMAGVYASNDNMRGVWTAPANVGIVGAIDLPIALDDSQQAGLNVDPATGKSINAIRRFFAHGILVWGARTLDGNSEDWRYIQVRRTIIYIEQSIREALQPFAFQPNDANTWSAVVAMIDNFLTDLWSRGGLQGASAPDAFSVSVGLGTTMSAQDILTGIMRVGVKLAVTHPADFILIEIDQQMGSSEG